MADYDVIVVGCGPAGLMAAGELAKRGINVLGIDKKPRLDENIRTASGYCFLDQSFNKEYIKMEPVGNKTKLHYTDSGFTLEYSGQMEGIYHSYMFSDTGRHWKASTRKKPLYNLFFPTKCISDRYGWAKKQGATFMPGTLVMRAKQSAHEVEVFARTNGKTKTLTCKKLIASDGLSSRIARSLNLNRTRTPFGKGPTIEWEMVGVECPYDRGDMFFFGGKNFGGRQGALIMVPSMSAKNAFRLETMSVLPASSASELIEYFTQKGPFSSWFKHAEIIDKSGAVVDMMTPMVTPYVGNVLFVGDSAAFAECLYQSATMAGYMSAVYTEEELKGKKGFDGYTQWWGDHFEWVRNPKRMADYTKRVLFPRFFSVKELDFLFELSEKNPIVVDEAEATPYDFTKVVMEQFIAMPEVPDALKQRMQQIIDGDMGMIATVIGQSQKA
ncbi:MAG: FAD-dependent monooxygenase [Proteobacteria bacterium]|nr:FAD-dependent monooxygenase [Pseudomonadota bacterium]